MAKKPVSIKIVDQGETSVVVSTFANGKVVRQLIVKTKARRKPIRPQRKHVGRDAKKQF